MPFRYIERKASILVLSSVVLYGIAGFESWLKVKPSTTEGPVSNGRWRPQHPSPLIEPLSLDFSDVVIESYIGKGVVSVVFRVRIPKVDPEKKYAMKVASIESSGYHDLEREIVTKLSKPPTLPSIPPLVYEMPSIENPFKKWDLGELRKLGISKKKLAKNLRSPDRVNVLVYPQVPHTGFPDRDDLEEIATLMHSLLEALDFSHQRNIMNCDISLSNIKYSAKTRTTYLFDWNGARVFAPNKVEVHQDFEFAHIVPPEARGDKHAVHLTVSAMDIWSAGVLLNYLLCKRAVCPDVSQSQSDPKWHAQSLARWLMTPDPYQRPNASQALGHGFFLLVS